MSNKNANYSTTKNVKRFSFTLTQNPTAKKAGSNQLTISTNNTTDGYSSASGTQTVSMTVREAKSLYGFLDSQFNQSTDV